jgi:MFS family permease
MNEVGSFRRHFAWFVVALLIPVALLNYLDRQMLATMKGSIGGEIAEAAGKTNWGIALGSFKWVYALLSPVGGYVADRVSRRLVVIVSLVIWSAVTGATAHVASFEQLVATRALMGVSEAFYFPAALALIADWHSSATRSRATGLHQMGVYAGVIVGGFAGYVADDPALGWRWAFMVCGIVGIAYAFPLALLLRDAPRVERDTRPTSPLTAAGQLARNRNFVLLALYFTLPAMAGWIVRDWMPDVLREQFHLGQGQAGVSAVLYVQLASLAGAAIGGWLADRWMRRTIRGRIFTSALGVSCFLPSLFGVGDAATLEIAIGFLILFGLGWGFFDSNNMPILCQVVRPELRATGYGVMNLLSIGCGGFADWGFGALLQRKVPLNAIYGLFAATALVSIAIVMRIRPSEAREENT